MYTVDMSIIQYHLGFLTYGSPVWQDLWAQRFYDYVNYTIIFLVILVAAFIGITMAIRRQKDQKIRKRLLLIRKAGTYLALIGWGLFVSIQMGWIWALFGQ